VIVVVPGPACVRSPVVDRVPTSGFEFCHAATLVRSRSVSEKCPVAIICILWGCPAGCEAEPIATEIDESVGEGAAIGCDWPHAQDESVGDGATVGFDWPHAQLERTMQIAEGRSRDFICPPLTPLNVKPAMTTEAI